MKLTTNQLKEMIQEIAGKTLKEQTTSKISQIDDAYKKHGFVIKSPGVYIKHTQMGRVVIKVSKIQPEYIRFVCNVGDFTFPVAWKQTIYDDIETCVQYVFRKIKNTLRQYVDNMF